MREIQTCTYSGAAAFRQTKSVMLYLLRENSVMPLVVRITASSKRIFQRYLAGLLGLMIPIPILQRLPN